MSGLLDEIHSRWEDNADAAGDTMPVADGTGLVLQARGFYDFLDGDQQLIDYLHIRKAVQTESKIEVRQYKLTTYATLSCRVTAPSPFVPGSKNPRSEEPCVFSRTSI